MSPVERLERDRGSERHPVREGVLGRGAVSGRGPAPTHARSLEGDEQTSSFAREQELGVRDHDRHLVRLRDVGVETVHRLYERGVVEGVPRVAEDRTDVGPALR
jgi:hypothetical protein